MIEKSRYYLCKIKMQQIDRICCIFLYFFFHKMVQKAAKLTAIFQRLNKKSNFAFLVYRHSIFPNPQKNTCHL